jgi:hypothetical protein
MPNYNFYDTHTEEIYVLRLKMVEREKYLVENPHIMQLPSLPALHSGRGMQKPDEGFRDILREMQKQNSKGINRASINTF